MGMRLATPRRPRTRTSSYSSAALTPRPLPRRLRVNVTNYDDIKRFYGSVPPRRHILPNSRGAIAPALKDITWRSAARICTTTSGGVLPPADDGLVEGMAAWHVPADCAADVGGSRGSSAPVKSERISFRARREGSGLVVASDARAAQLFGQGRFPEPDEI